MRYFFIFLLLLGLACVHDPSYATGKQAPETPGQETSLEELMREAPPEMCVQASNEPNVETAINMFSLCIKEGIGNRYWLAMAHGERGILYIDQERLDAAIADLTLALSIVPDNLQFLLLRAGSLAVLKRWNEALADLDTIIALDPGNVEVYSKRADCHMQAGMLAEALRDMETVLEMMPDDLFTLNNMAWILATWEERDLRDGERAVTIAERVVALGDRSIPSHLDTLAAAYAEAGRFEDAIRTQEEALKLAREQGEDLATYQLDMEFFQRNETIPEPYFQ